MKEISIRLESDSLRHQIRSARMVALLIKQHAEPVERIGIPGLARQELLIQRRGPIQVPGTVHCNGGSQGTTHGGNGYPRKRGTPSDSFYGSCGTG